MTIEELAGAATTTLRGLAGLPLPAAREAARKFGNEHGIPCRVISEPDPLDGAPALDLLLELPDGVLSIGFVPHGGLPFPLRGAQRWSEGELLAVNGRPLRVATAMASLDFIWQDRTILDRLVASMLVRDEIERRGITVTEAEVDDALDDWRLRRGQLRPEQTEAFLARTGVTLERLESILRTEVAERKLVQAIASGRIGEAFERAPERHARARASYLVAKGEIELAPGGLLVLADALAREDRLVKLELHRAVYAGELPSAIDAAVFGAAASVGCDGELAYAAVCHERLPPVLDAATAARIEQMVFADWLTERRATARVEWFWGQD